MEIGIVAVEVFDLELVLSFNLSELEDYAPVLFVFLFYDDFVCGFADVVFLGVSFFQLGILGCESCILLG